jgi:hypothetical protein
MNLMVSNSTRDNATIVSAQKRTGDKHLVVQQFDIIHYAGMLTLK